MGIQTATYAIALSIAASAWATPAAPEEKPPEVLIEATIERGGDFLAFGFDSLWMMSGRKLVRINPDDNSVTDIPIEGAVGSYRGISIGEGAVWVPDVGSKTIYKVDPRANKIVLQIPSLLFDSEGSIGVGEGAVWAVTGSNGQILARYDAQNGNEVAKVPLPSTSSGVVADFGSVWVTGTAKSELYRVDPKTNQIVTTTALNPEPRFLTSGEGSIWVLNQGDGTVQRIDGKTGEVLATIEADAAGEGGDIAVGGGFVWLSTILVPVIRIDPNTNSFSGKFKRPSGVYLGDAIRYGDDSLWISGNSIFRIKPPG
ncbi:hypothetical protein NKH09_30395 [Mesorhizobium sp. M1339]|uniref:Vgb family protein n=1 Tax=unclassified Mesorhizobium TaxID=325217 RepID=UPI00333D2C9D